MEEEESLSFLGQEKISKLMRQYAVPCIISLLVAALYNIVDQIFISNATYLGSNGNSANTIVFPLTVIALAIAVMIGDGCCSYVSICLGAKDEEKAHRSVGNAIILSIVCGLVVTGIYLAFPDAIVSAFGADKTNLPVVYDLAKTYFFFITLGIPFYMFGQAMNPIIRSDGSPNFAMASTLAGAAINIVLDPIFIYICKWGMMGAALATISGQIVTAILAVWYLLHFKAVRIRKSSFKMSFNICKKFLPLGITSFLSQISMVFSMMAVNNMIAKYGVLDPIFGQTQYMQIPMAVVGIVMKFFQVVISISVGMAAGCIPIVGYNIGAGRKDRAKELFKLLLMGEALVGLVATIIVEAFPTQLIGIFGASNESIYYTQFAVKSFRIYLCLLIPACVNKASFIYLQALGRAFLSTTLSLIREIIFGAGFALLLPMFFGLDGVLYSMPVSDFLTFIIVIFVVVMIFRQLNSNDKKEVVA